MFRTNYITPKFLLTFASLSMGFITISYNNKGQSFYIEFVGMCSARFLDYVTEMVLTYFIFMVLILLSSILSIVIIFRKGIKLSLWLGIFNFVLWSVLTAEFYRWGVLDVKIFWNTSLPFLLFTITGFHAGTLVSKTPSTKMRFR